MAQPTTGEVQHFYCDCLVKKRQESFSDKDYRKEERTLTERTTGTTAWICKCRKYKSFRRSKCLFSSEWVTTWQYWWECMNCGKQRVIGVWDSEGGSYGDGHHLKDE